MKKFYPVIHVHNLEQVESNIGICKAAGADGIFLINHGRMGSEVFLELVEEVVKDHQRKRDIVVARPTFDVGVNFLGCANLRAMMLAGSTGCSMLWSDNANTDEFSLDPCRQVLKHQRFLADNLQTVPRFFGGVQFKYQPKPGWDIGTSIDRSLPFVDVPTVSGRGTGQAADVDFIRRAHAATQKGLAIASGVDIDNVGSYLPFIDNFLVATSIIDRSSKCELFDASKVNALAERIRKGQ